MTEMQWTMRPGYPIIKGELGELLGVKIVKNPFQPAIDKLKADLSAMKRRK